MLAEEEGRGRGFTESDVTSPAAPCRQAGRQTSGGFMTPRQLVERERRIGFLIIVGLIVLFLLG
ncbi:hypothetical protein [Tautonia plasticadhaerens]|uniref:hypothetical protein n=1 Tax=Tautonia plasticadhaerens TaxID=2527974 RepID=UPI0011A7961B|nr:hypothetical protein [Tautonia plasticadhaerens]